MVTALCEWGSGVQVPSGSFQNSHPSQPIPAASAGFRAQVSRQQMASSYGPCFSFGNAFGSQVTSDPHAFPAARSDHEASRRGSGEGEQGRGVGAALEQAGAPGHAWPGCPPPGHLHPSRSHCRQLRGLHGGCKPTFHPLTMETSKPGASEPSVLKCSMDLSDVSYSSAVMKSFQQA